MQSDDLESNTKDTITHDVYRSVSVSPRANLFPKKKLCFKHIVGGIRKNIPKISLLGGPNVVQHDEVLNINLKYIIWMQTKDEYWS